VGLGQDGIGGIKYFGGFCMDKIKWPVIVFASFVLILAAPARAMDEEMGSFEAAQKAREAHKVAASDMIYQQEEWKALYYQNIQVIQLLKEIRDTLDAIKSQGSQSPKEKTG